MKKLIFMLICLVCINSFADSESDAIKSLLEEPELTYAMFLVSGYLRKTITEPEYISELKSCALEKNEYCLSFLGTQYFDEKQYALAYPILLLSSGISSRKYSETALPTVELELRDMFLYGFGVLQNDEKAMDYYIKSAQHGNAKSAGRISSVYQAKLLLNKNGDEYKSNLMLSYAWLKVAQALGLEIYSLKDDDGSTELVSTRLESYKLKLVEISSLELADQLAAKTCSNIKECIQ